MKSVKWISVATSAVMAALVASSAFAADAVEIRMSWWGGDSRHKATQAAIKAFEEKYPNIKVKAEFTGWTGHQERLTTQISGKTEADLMQVNWPWLPLFSKRGDGFANLRDFADVLDLTQFDESLLATATVNGKLNGIPVSTTGRVYMFNPVLFKKAGLDVPKSWGEVISAAKVFQEKLGPNYFPFSTIDLNPWYTAVHVVTQKTGKSFIDPETSKIAWTKDQIAEGLQLYVDLEDAKAIQNYKQASAEGGARLSLHKRKDWIEGRIGGSYEWDSVYFKFRDPLGPKQDLVSVDTFMVPGAVNEGLLRKPTMMFCVSKNSKHQKEAAMLLNFLLNDPVGVRILKTSRGIPASKSAYKLVVDEGLIDPKQGKAHDTVVNGEAPKLSPFFEHPKMQELYRTKMEELSYRKISVKDAAAALYEEGSAILAKVSR